jgi:hypothetical protein
MFVPTNSVMEADHCVVPDAVPAPPVDVVHVTEVTPTLSIAVPLKVMADEATETMVEPGERIVSDGGVLSDPEG